MEYPNLSQAKEIAVDLETYDPNLAEYGPGGVRRDGYVLGYALAVHGLSLYVPVGHPNNPIDPVNARKWLRDTLGSTTPKIGANILYDLEWAKTDGVSIRGKKYDIQTAEFLLNESLHSYKLDSIGKSYFGEEGGKNEEGLAESVARALGKDINYKPKEAEIKGNLHLLEAHKLEKYARRDAELTLAIWSQQAHRLAEEDLTKVMEVETQCVDVLLDMRFKGIKVDIDKAHKAKKELEGKAEETKKICFDLAGGQFNPLSSAEIANIATRLGLNFEKTEKGNPSFSSPWLATQTNVFFTNLLLTRQYTNAAKNLIGNKIIDFSYKGRIHPNFHQVRVEKPGTDKMAGTGKGRFSSSSPNIQQIPSRHPYLGPLIRGIFLPEDGELWDSSDASQQEPRLTTHYAYLLGKQKEKIAPGNVLFKTASFFRERFLTDPILADRSLINDKASKNYADMHTITAELAGIDRTLAKTINLGLAYGMGKKKCAEALGLPLDQAEEVIEKYHKAMPFVRDLGGEVTSAAEKRGYIKTLLGRRCRFPLFAPAKFTPGAIPLEYEEAIERYGSNIRRADCRKALNNLVQGGGADWMKKAMIDCHSAGYTPLLTEHDALMFSIKNKQEGEKIVQIMEDSIKLEVPMRVDMKIGKSWGEAK